LKALLLCAALACACAPSLPEGYLRARDSAEKAYGSGHFADAGQGWLEAAQRASTARDRSEARYRAATSFERAGQLDRARELYTLLANGHSDRAPRSTFALADLRLQSGDAAGGNAALEAAIRKYPSSGVAHLALRRYFAVLSERGGDRAVLDYIQQVEPELSKTDLAEQLLYERGRRLVAEGATARARDTYDDLANRFPYPHGAYWDDALFRGADCEMRLGQPERAIALLERMLNAREASHLSGSYERPRFADAAYHLAELYRDARHDTQAARRAFHGVFIDYPTSTLRDDALWQEAMLARHVSDTAACAPLALLVEQLADSRYAPCAHEICLKIAAIPRRECAGYLQREFRDQKPEPKPE
jgi:TolA-binding protein